MSAALDVASPKADEMVGSSPSESSPMPSPQVRMHPQPESTAMWKGGYRSRAQAEEVLPFESGSDAGLPDDEVPAIEARKLTVVSGGGLRWAYNLLEWSRSRSRSASVDSLGRRRRRDSSYSSRRRRSVSSSHSRSRSPSYGRHRSRRSRSGSRGRSRSRRRLYHSRSRSKSLSPVRRRRSTSRSKPRKVKDATKEQAKPQVKEQQEEINAMSHLSEEEQMKLLLGIGGFDSTKGKAVEENLKSAATGTARRETKREYRQYMNRRGGFNRPLDMS
ncbi:U4/U6.U5 small nuclear ribonucleoprotein 27 kDa protein, putative [Phytophthora infestans T30-4]|uniref:U4/U6.U5 small nuclear ribonucleoprotein 27 kDa protein, putative n=1 Tax=Phytophthora infestans (strain T30-4) TaxID=403677 RepID=D0NIQ7_PHYIT|nr:U4/U6.U5 small nuclear ribonucleoprotein 27 kDa protein, putative [Phytophthora infestans T30-4]EEY59391.1 U4/U6.U5 small nuclear ribonucleoprotein 27 kDa protein, putative [Phytophthora infestans T30-4]|eukprot:XP_002901001.1 U4/U6.U5 small nuclear ribonucleoprotein 27 kDa protein, putative [Phytophthora infestans T30-4]